MAKRLTKKDFIKQASLTRRVFAYVIDMLLLNVILLSPLIKEIRQIMGDKNMDLISSYNFFLDNPQKVYAVLVLSIIMVLLTLLYFSVLEFKLRQTLGKMVLDIKVMSKKANFKYSQALIRNISKPISVLFLFDMLYFVFTRKNQRYFEKISETAVMHEVIKI